LNEKESAMDYVKPQDVVASMVDAGTRKANLSIKDLLLRGFLSGALLGIATSLAVGANTQTGQPIVGALVFPVGFAMIVLLGLELVTGSFALLPMALLQGRIGPAKMLSNWGWVLVGNLIGSMVYAVLLSVALTNGGSTEPAPVGAAIVKIAEAKTIAYAAHGQAGWMTAFVKAILCNWMVCMGVAMAMVSTGTLGKIAAAWMPIVIFFAQGFEHAVVNMFVIPAGILMGAQVTVGDWWIWNQIPVLLGNVVGALALTALPLLFSYRPARDAVSAAAPVSAPAKA
jgi:formate transporter